MIYEHNNPMEASVVADVVIVGGGPGGASVARELTAGGLEVVMLEDGPGTRRFLPSSYANISRFHMQIAELTRLPPPTPRPAATGKVTGPSARRVPASCMWNREILA